MSEFDVFLSHNSKDKPAVRDLADALVARGLRPWLDERQLVPGRPWQDALEQIIQTTKTAAVLFGPAGLGPWEEPEMRGCLSEFVDRKLPVIPVLLPGAPEKPKLPLFLRALTWVDLRGGITDEGLDLLQWGITGEKPIRREAPGKRPVDVLQDQAPHLSAERLAELTSFASEQIAVAAQGWLDTECAPFIVPSLARHGMGDEPGQMMRPSRQRQPLDDDQVEMLVLGQLPATANRVRIVGDSGMGKTALLHYCQCRIAGTNDGRLPIRIDGLSGCNWTLRREEVLQWMAHNGVVKKRKSRTSARAIATGQSSPRNARP